MSVVIPAHDEAAVIARCLGTLLADAETDELEVVVVCNGCTDRTAELARLAAPSATVLELDEASKTAALRAGDESATTFPRAYLDADVEVGVADLRAVAQALGGGPAVGGPPDGVATAVGVAAPVCAFELGGRPWYVRRFYDAWARLPYVGSDLIGNGLYVLSAAGRERFGEFPEITADDLFVRELFDPDERLSVRDAAFVVHTPRSWKGLLAMRERTYRGNAELARHRPDLGVKGASTGASLVGVARAAPASFAVYVGVNLAAKARLRTRRRTVRWERDDSAREMAAVPASAPASPEAPRVAYLTSQYPATSHTFVLREVQALRAAGWVVDTFTVRDVDDDVLLAATEREEAASTEALLPTTLPRLVGSLATALRTSPGGWADAAGRSLRAGGGDPRRSLWQAFYLAEAVLLYEAMRRRGVRHVHVHFANVAADVARLAVAIGNGAGDGDRWSWSFTMHGPRELSDVERFDLASKVCEASAVVCISDYCRSQLMALVDQRQWPKLAVAHCGVDTERFGLVQRTRRDHPSAPLKVLCVGRLVREKAQTLLVAAVAEAVARGVDAHLVLAGDGPCRAEVERAVARHEMGGRVELTGAVSQDDIVELYAAADVFALASFAEGVPVVLMEAMATGLPVVATQIAGIAELVEDGRSGRLVAPGRPDELAAALTAIAEDPELGHRMGRAGRARVVDDFEISACAAQVGSIIARAMGRPHDGADPDVGSTPTSPGVGSVPAPRVGRASGLGL